MAVTREEKEARRLWEEHCKRVQSLTELSPEAERETRAQRDARIRRLLADYPAFCEYYFPHYMRRTDPATGLVTGIVHNAPFHNAAFRDILRNRTFKAVFMWPRGHAKSTHLDIFIPINLMVRGGGEIHCGIIVNKSEDGAKTLLADLQAELEYNQRLIADFGTQKNVGDWQQGEFSTTGGVKWFAVGRGQSPRGLKKQEQRPDYIVIDDLDDDEMSHNEERVRQATDWVKQALFGALDVGRGRFLMVGNGFAKHMVLKNIADIPSVKVSKVYAVDSNGAPVWADKWTKAEAEAYADFVGYASWQREMMHNPVAEGGIFKWQWIRYKKILPLRKYDQIICYIDPSFKSTTANDYKAARVWGKTGRELHLIDCYVRQDTVAGMVRWLYDFHESLPEDVAVSYFMEANFMQDIILDEFAREGDLRGYQLPIMPDRRKKPDKLQRIEAVSPLWERGLVYYNEAKRNDTDMKTGIDQTLSLARGSRAHDDAPDADEGAIYKLQKASREERFEPIFGERPAPKGAW